MGKVADRWRRGCMHELRVRKDGLRVRKDGLRVRKDGLRVRKAGATSVFSTTMAGARRGQAS